MHLKVKICGVTREEDALMAAQLGAFAVGLVMAESPRRVNLVQAERIFRALDGQTNLVAVFQDATVREIASVLNEIPLIGIQLHGEESVTYIQELRAEVNRKFILIKRVKDCEQIETYRNHCETLLFEPLGGVNKTNVATQADKLFIAGGIDCDNVGQLVQRLRPAGIDLARGVEASPGVKDHDKLRKLFREVGYAI